MNAHTHMQLTVPRWARVGFSHASLFRAHSVQYTARQQDTSTKPGFVCTQRATHWITDRNTLKIHARAQYRHSHTHKYTLSPAPLTHIPHSEHYFCWTIRNLLIDGKPKSIPDKPKDKMLKDSQLTTSMLLLSWGPYEHSVLDWVILILRHKKSHCCIFILIYYH